MIRKLIWQGERYPRGYGMAWIDFQRNAVVCYPIPLNVVMRAVYLAWVWCLCPFGVTEREVMKTALKSLKAIDVTCPTCCAKPGWPCRTRTSMDEGVVRNLAQRYGERYPHAARIRAAKEKK